MRFLPSAAVALTILLCAPAQAEPFDAVALDRLVQPALTARLDFGGAPRSNHWQLGLRLDYAEPLRRELAQVAGARQDGRERLLAGPGAGLVLPALAQWQFSSADQLHTLSMNGLVVGTRSLALGEDAYEGEAPVEKKRSLWGLNVGAMLLAGGAAVALLVAAAGDAADDANDGNGDGVNVGANGDGNDACVGVEVADNCVGTGT